MPTPRGEAIRSSTCLLRFSDTIACKNGRPSRRASRNPMAEPSAAPPSVRTMPSGMPNRYPAANCGNSPGITKTTTCSTWTAMNTAGAATP